jgi:DeoR/GlpR family transcriptional regulator of sugar metabolism
LKTSDATIKRDLQYLKENGIIERIDGNRGGHWIIKKLSERWFI